MTFGPPLYGSPPRRGLRRRRTQPKGRRPAGRTRPRKRRLPATRQHRRVRGRLMSVVWLIGGVAGIHGVHLWCPRQPEEGKPARGKIPPAGRRRERTSRAPPLADIPVLGRHGDICGRAGRAWLFFVAASLRFTGRGDPSRHHVLVHGRSRTAEVGGRARLWRRGRHMWPLSRCRLRRQGPPRPARPGPEIGAQVAQARGRVAFSRCVFALARARPAPVARAQPGPARGGRP